MTEQLLADIRFAVRSMRKRPGFTLTAIATLALGIGATTAIFSIVNPFLWRPLPFQDSSRLVHLFGTDRSYEGFGWNMARMSHADFQDLASSATSFAATSPYYYEGVNITGGAEPEGTTLGRVGGNMFPLLGVPAAIGRGILPADAEPGAEAVIVLGDGLWRRTFGADSTILGRTIRVDQESYTVVGVMPAGFDFPFPGVKLWAAMALDPNEDRDSRYLLGVARLADGAGLHDARTEANALAARLETAYPATNADVGFNVVSLRSGLIFFFDMLRTVFLALLAAVGLLLLIACANVANMLLSRVTSRHREIAVRTALGASRRQIVRQLLTENAVLAGIAAIVGVTFAYQAVGPMATAIPEDLWRSGPVAVDLAALTFAVAISVATTLLFGLAPALQATRKNLTHALKDGGRTGTEGARGRRLSNALVIAEVALALAILAGTSGLVLGVQRVQRMDLGFAPEGVLTAQISAPDATYPDGEAVDGFRHRVIEQLEGTPGVRRAAAAAMLPMNFETGSATFSIPGRTDDLDRFPTANANSISPGFLNVMSVRLIAGRDLLPSDGRDAEPVVLVSRRMVERYFPNEDPLGRTLFIHPSGDDREPYRIVGVVDDFAQGGVYEAEMPQVYFAADQRLLRRVFLVIAVDGDPEALTPAVRQAVWNVDRTIPVSAVRTMDTVVNESLGPMRGVAGVLTILSVGALLLAGGGIFGVISYAVGLRIHEFGLRTALGATSQAIFRLVLRHGALLTGIGLAIGLGIGVLGLQMVSQILPAFGAISLPALIVSPMVLLAVALLACYVPARRATRITPMEALRYE